ncbi:hypothetical protein V8C86DRAFT_2457585 [Haematococcus lacustris]
MTHSELVPTFCSCCSASLASIAITVTLVMTSKACMRFECLQFALVWFAMLQLACVVIDRGHAAWMGLQLS